VGAAAPRSGGARRRSGRGGEAEAEAVEAEAVEQDTPVVARGLAIVVVDAGAGDRRRILRWCNVVAIELRVVRVAEQALAEAGFVTPIDVLVGLGWLTPADVENWRRGRVPYLERVTQAGLGKLSTAMRAFRRWARRRGLRPSQTDYRSWTRSRTVLRFSKSGNPHIELAYRTHWIGPSLPAHQHDRVRQPRDAPAPDA
jgi:hypothetical protein